MRTKSKTVFSHVIYCTVYLVEFFCPLIGAELDAVKLDALIGWLSELGGPDAIRRMGKNLHYFVNLTGLGQQEYIVNAFPSKIETLEFCETSLTPFE